MKLKSGKRVVALALSFMLTICGIQFPAVTAHAESQTPSGVISSDGTTLTYGERDSLDGEDFAPVEITDSDQISYFTNEAGNFEMTMVFRLNETGLTKGQALFTLEDPDNTHTNGSSKFITAYYKPNNGVISFICHSSSSGIRWTMGDLVINDTKYHKMSISFSGRKLNISLDGVKSINELNGSSASWSFDVIESFLQDSTRTNTKFYIGKKAGNGTYAIESWNGAGTTYDLDGVIRYVEFSKNAFTKESLLNYNKEVNADLGSAFGSYVSTHETKQETDYTAETWAPFETALQAAQTVNASKTEQGIYNTYGDLKTAVEGLDEFVGANNPPTAKTLSRTLVKGRTLAVAVDELAEDPDGDRLTISVPSENSKLNLTVGDDGRLQISCKDGIEAGTDLEQVTVVVTDTRGASVNVTFPVKIEETLKLEYDLRDRDFDPASDPSSVENIYKAEVEDMKVLNQIKDSMEVSMTFRFNEHKAYHKENATNTGFFYLMELGDSANNYSSNDTNGGRPSAAASTLSFLTDITQGKIYCNTGAYFATTDWELLTGTRLNDNRAHTLTFSISADGFHLYLDGGELKSTSANSSNKNSGNFVKAFFGDTSLGSFYKNWSADADTLTIGDSYEFSAGRHPNYGRFGGEIQSVVISDGTYSEESLLEHHKSWGTENAKEDLQETLDQCDSLDVSILNLLKQTEMYQKAQEIINGTRVTYAADIYNTISDIQSALNDIDNIGLTDIGGSISGMFNSDADNSWIFGGGVETQGRFAEIAGLRNYIGHFEEYIRWALARNNEMHRQRYTINVAKDGGDAVEFAGRLDDYIVKLDPKAVSYMIGPEDYSKGDAGIDAFKAAISSILEKSLAIKQGKGFAVIQLPHAVQDETKAELVKKYVQAAKDAMRTYIIAHPDQKDRIVMIDHTALTDTDDFKNRCLTEDGLLNAEGHFEIADQMKQKMIGTSGSLQAITRWTQEDAPEKYENKRPAVTAEEGGKLKVVIPADAAAGKTEWEYKIEIGDMEICGSAQEETGRTFTIDELPEGEQYVLTLKTKDNAVQLSKVYGTLKAGDNGGAAELSELQKKIKAKADDTSKPLTWLFMGDSITHAALWMNGYDGIAQTFEKYLKEDLGRSDDIVINTAVSGASTQTTLNNIEQRLGKYTPDIVSIMLGTNDSGEDSMRSYTFAERLRTIVAKIRERNKDALIIFRSPTPIDDRTTDKNRKGVLETSLLKTMEQVAEEDGNILYIDQYTEWDAELDTFPYLYGNRYYYGNNLHPGPVGQLRMTQQFIRECGLSTDTRIANLAYRFNYTDTTSDTTPDFTEGRTRIALEKAEIETLQAESGKTFGSMEVTVTDEEAGRTYTKRDYTAGDRFILRFLPNSGANGRNYQVSVTGTVAGTAEKVKFNDAQVTLSPQNEVLPYYVFLDRTYIREFDEGDVAGRLYTGIAAPEGTYHYEFVNEAGQSNDNSLFEIEGDAVKIKNVLQKYRSYTICVQAVKDGDNENRSLKAAYTLRTMPTLDVVREDAETAFNSEDDMTGFDLDLSNTSFEDDAYIELGEEGSSWYEDGKYLAVLNKLRETTTGGTIIYRFRTNQANTLIFGSGSNKTAVANDNTIMAFGLSGGETRGIFRATATGLRGNFDSGGTLNDGKWHTVAISFDTTKKDFQKQVIISVDGSENIFRSDWWTKDNISWFNQHKDQPITHFAIGGGLCATTLQLGAQLSKFTGDISFVTVNGQAYTEEELRLLTNMDWITGEQALQINGTAVTLPEDAAYTASPIAWDDDNAEAEFTLTANEGALFDDTFSVSIVNGATLGVLDQIQIERAADDRSVNVRFSTSQWRSDDVFEREEISIKNGVSTDAAAVLDKEIIEKLDGMRRGSVTVRYRLDETALDAEGRLALFSISNGSLNGYSAFYVAPSTGTIGYSIRNQEGNASFTINSDEAARENIKNQNWHTVTYLFTASGTEIYLDGIRILANTEVGFFRNTANAGYAQMGSVYRSADDAHAFAFSGEINYMQVTYDVLDADEIQELHAATTRKTLELPEEAVKTEDMNLYYEDYQNSPYYRMPSLLTTSKGTVIAAVDKRQTTEADRGNIDTIIRRSTDGGKTWGEPQTIFNQPDGSAMYSFTTAPTMVEGKDGRIHMIANLFPESQGRLSTGLIEKGSGFKEVNGKLYPILRNYINTALNAEGTWTQEYTIREDGVVYEETEEGSRATNYSVPNYLAANGGGDLYSGTERVGNIYVYTGANAGELKVPRVMSVVTCYSDDNGATWDGYQNITGMIKEDWMKFMRVGPGAGIRLEHQTNTALNGRIVVPVCYTNGDGIHSYASALIYSDDNGVTWERTDTPVSQVNKVNVKEGTFKDYSLRESQIVEMNDGTIQMFSINYSGRLKMSTGAFGADGMKWTDVKQTTIQDLASPISVIHMPQQVDGKEAILLSAPLGPGSNNGYIHIGLYQEDGTFEWKYLRKIKADGFGNSCMSMLGNDSIGILFKGTGEDITFTSMSEKWLSTPRYADFEKPVIEDITMDWAGSELTFTVTLDTAMMKKGSPVLKLKLNGTTDAQAAYVSGNASNCYVFRYDMGEQELESVTAVNVAMPDTAGFVEGVAGLMPDDVAFEFEFTRDAIINEINKALEEYREIYESDGSGYDETLWEEFRDAYKAVQDAITREDVSARELAGLLKDLRDARKKLDETGEPDPGPGTEDPDLEEIKNDLKKALDDYKDIFENKKADYTPESWKAFEEAYKEVQKALEDGSTDKEALKGLQDALLKAFKELSPIQNSTPDPIITVTKLAAPNITSLKAVAEKKAMGVKIQVEKVANADVYTVFRKVGSSVKEIGRTNAAGVVYDQTPVSKKTASYYAVAEAASGQYLKSDNGAAKTIKLTASVKKITAKRVGKKTQVRLSWKKVKNAQKYVVYRSTKKDSGYVRLKTLKKSAKSYVDKKVKKGKTYYYRIVVKTKKGYSGVTTSKKLKIKK